jgi:hypothetical protein
MMRYVSIRNLAPLCGVVLGLLVLCNAASPTILQASDDAGGWWLVPVGAACGGDTNLWCSAGQDWGVQHCLGGSFYGVKPPNPQTGTVQPRGGSAGCSPNPAWERDYPGISANCGNVINTYCSTSF